MRSSRRSTEFGLVAAVLGLLLASCGGGTSEPTGGGGGGPTGFSIKGKLATPALRTGARGQANLAAPQVAKVLAFSPSRWWSGSVTAGAFQLEIDPTAPTGIVFAGPADEFLGALLLPSGFAAIPLQVKSDGVTSVDLGTVMSSGTVFTPGHDPVGAEIQLGTADRAALKLLEGTFGAAVRNPDADGDGRIDLLQGRFYRPYFQYWVEGGGFAGGVAAAPVVPAAVSGFRLGIHVNDTAPLPSTVTFTGPAGSGLSGVVNDAPAGTGTGWAAYGSPHIENPTVPPGGRYTIGLGARTLAFDIGDQSTATEHVALTVPTVTLNADGTVASVAWTYRLGDQSGTVQPSALIQDLILQIDGDGTSGSPPCAANGGISVNQGTRAYNSPNFGAAVTSHVLACQNIRWTSVRAIFMAYNDVYGNHVVVSWRK